MTRRIPMLLALVAGAMLAAGAGRAQVTSAQQSALRANCRADFMSHCAGVQPGGKDALLCLQKNVDALSGGCQAAVRATLPAVARPEPARPEPVQPQPAKPQPPKSQPPKSEAAGPEPATQTMTAAPPPAPVQAPVAAPAGTPEPTPVTPHRLKPKPPAPAPAAAATPAIVAAPPAAAPNPEQIKAVKFTCRGDARRLCKGVPDGPEMFGCLQRHEARVSANCRTALADLAASMPAGAAIPAPAAVTPAAHPPKAPMIDAAVVLRACKLDVVRHCRGAGVGDGRMLACRPHTRPI